ncbi:hypothetical protein BDR07DRAFT_1491342 [Suillus spraguei]|nr:hypothetical protein BDR07DRAFT_1491342 [Suillus spraguei]
MACPTLYKTHQARLQAAREKCHRHYQKFRESILAKRRQSRKEKKSQGSEPSDDEDEPIETLHDCIATVKYAKDDFMAYVKLHPTANGDKSIFERAITRLEDFLDQANCGLDGILQMCGVSDEWRAADGVCRFMREMIGMIKDILLCLVEGGDGELSIAFMGNELWYQEYKFPV